jgi:hypothetical protein
MIPAITIPGADAEIPISSNSIQGSIADAASGIPDGNRTVSSEPIDKSTVSIQQIWELFRWWRMLNNKSICGYIAHPIRRLAGGSFGLVVFHFIPSLIAFPGSAGNIRHALRGAASKTFRMTFVISKSSERGGHSSTAAARDCFSPAGQGAGMP